MSAAMDTRLIEDRIMKGSPFIQATYLRRALREFCRKNSLPWEETVTERRNSAGAKIGPEMTIGPASATLMLEAADRIDRTLTQYLDRLIPTPERVFEPSGPQPCPVYDWCDANDSPAHVEDGFHMEVGVTEVERGYLRTDHVVEDGVVKLEIADSISWQIEADESREFFQTLRAAIDTAEAKFEEFKARVKAGEEQ